MSIDPSSRIDPSAVIEDGVTIAPWCIVGPAVSIGAGSVIESHVVIRSHTRIGKNNRFFQFSSIGEDPSDKKFEGEEAWLDIGDNNVFREGVTLHRGTGFGGGLTKIGNDNLLMPYVHIAHDCVVGNNTVFANNAGLSGHVEVDDWAILGGFAGVNQFVKIGAHAMVGGVTHVGQDVPAYMLVSGQPAAVRSINTVGLSRRGFSDEAIKDLRTAFKVLYRRGLSLSEALEELRGMLARCPEVAALIASIESSTKGIQR
jgi:UDP-N-acetylglucosamine acyltransferase